MTSLRAKIVDAGSIGNHLANASRLLGWDVVLCHVDPAAARTRDEIYPGRYGASGEHSHAINLWQHLARCMGAGEVVRVTASLDYSRNGSRLEDREVPERLEKWVDRRDLFDASDLRRIVDEWRGILS